MSENILTLNPPVEARRPSRYLHALRDTLWCVLAW